MNLEEHIKTPLHTQMLESWKNDSKTRTYLGGSQIGHECERYLWLQFHKAFKSEFPGRILRLFNRGHREEPVFVEELERLGVKISGDQFGVSACGGFMRGHIDGVGVGIPGETKPCLLEYKTMSEKYFKEMQKKGVEEAKPIYFAQMQIYMYLCDLDRGYFICVNKNNDDLYSERVKLKKSVAKDLLKKADRVIFNDYAPQGISDNPAFFKCKWCDASDVCFEHEKALKNCRMCVNWEININGTEKCINGLETKNFAICENYISKLEDIFTKDLF